MPGEDRDPIGKPEKPAETLELGRRIAAAEVRPATDNDRALHQAAEFATRRGMVVVLGDLFGVLRAAAHEPAIAKDLGAEMLDEGLERLGLAGEERACQRGFVKSVQTPIVARGIIYLLRL